MDNKGNAELGEAEVRSLREHAKRVAEFDLGADAEYGSHRNVVGLRSADRIFSRRLDSNTLFARNEHCGIGQAQGTWTGAKRPVESACRKVLRAAGVASKEIAAVSTVTEVGGTVGIESEPKRPLKPATLRRIAKAERAISDIPVWSSYCTVELTAAGELGSIELHWPSIVAEIETEAKYLSRCVIDSFQPRKMEGCEVESVEAGIVHSAPIGFFMDVRSVIRVIYRPDESGFGRKAVAYLDRHGNDVELPRSIEPATPENRGGDRHVR